MTTAYFQGLKAAFKARGGKLERKAAGIVGSLGDVSVLVADSDASLGTLRKVLARHDNQQQPQK